MVSFTLNTAIAILAAAQAANAHTWAEVIKRIEPDGRFSKDTGFPYPFVPRGTPGVDDQMINRITTKDGNPKVCRGGAYTDAAPRLRASPGDAIAILYEENGHVTDPKQTPRPPRGGKVNVYGTMNPINGLGINDVLGPWNKDGKGGDGRLLGSQFYDDGQCYQNRGGDPNFPVYTERKARYNVDSLMCQTDFRLPEDLPTEGTYNLMWVWDWPLVDGAGNPTSTEIYTSCIEIQLTKRDGPPPAINVGAIDDIRNFALAGAIGNPFQKRADEISLGPRGAQPISGPQTMRTMIRSLPTEVASV